MSDRSEEIHRSAAGPVGSCSICHDPIPSAELLRFPDVGICLECMSPEERDALEHDLESASRVQRTLLPPRDAGNEHWAVDYLWEPHGAVSGDHVDIVRPRGEGDPLHLLLGDVAGKGVAASMVQSQLHALFRALAPRQTTLGELLASANELLFEATSPERYATLTALRLHPDGRVELANAGHPRPLLSDRRGVRPVEGASMPLGMFADVSYTGHELTLHPGDTLFLYTDGLTEAAKDQDEYGVGRAAASLRRSAALDLPDLLAASRADMEEFLGGAARGDDLTLVAVRRLR